MEFVLLGVMALFVVLAMMQTKRRKAMQVQVEQMLDELRPGMRVRTVGGIMGRIKEIREEAPTVKTVLLQTGNDKFPSYMLFDINAIYGVIAEEGHNLDGSPVVPLQNAGTSSVENSADNVTLLNGEEVVGDDFDAKDYVSKSTKAQKQHK
jgi:preprotein translocase YajC subunit